MQQPLLLLVSHYYDNGYEITIAVAEDVTAINEAITQFKIKFSVAVIFILIILLSMQMWGLKKGLTPLRQLQQDLKNLEKGKITHLDTYVPIELNSLVKEINQLHSALDVKLSRHRNALADLAHALKKPLTVLQLLSKDEQLIHLPNIKATLTKQTEITNQLIHRILNKARLAGKVKASSVFDFKTDLTELIDTLNMMYQQRNITIMVNCADNLSTTFDREDLLELLGNLLDNAFKWAKSTVIVTINQQQDFSINVEDDGNGIPTDKLPYIPQRGLRLDETVAGHGLGLGIVDDIIEHYEGSINYQTSPQLGGLRVSISLPLK